MRVTSWPDRLADVFHEAQGKPFEYGTWDCCQFAARAVAAITGADPREVFPPYASEAEAGRIIAQHGGFAGLVTHALGEPMPNKAFARRGDIVLCDFGRGLQPAVCAGVACVAPGASGLEHRPMASAVMAWSV